MYHTAIHVRIIGSVPIACSRLSPIVCIKFSACLCRQALLKRPHHSPTQKIPMRMIQEKTAIHLKSVVGVVGREEDREEADLEVEEVDYHELV